MDVPPWIGLPLTPVLWAVGLLILNPLGWLLAWQLDRAHQIDAFERELRDYGAPSTSHGSMDFGGGSGSGPGLPNR